MKLVTKISAVIACATVFVCSIDGSCPCGSCIQSNCTTPCTLHAGCGAGESCQKGKCLAHCRPGGSNVAADHVCLHGFVVPQCKPSQDGAPCGDQCWDRFDCASDINCVENMCSGFCSTESQCPEEDMQCESGEGCVYKCSANAECNPYQRCNGEYCETLENTDCTSDEDCGTFLMCVKLLCVPIEKIGAYCRSDSSCGVHEVCPAGKCSCLRNYRGDCIGVPPPCPTSGTCNDIIRNAECNADHNWCECQSERVLVGNRCLNVDFRTCGTDEECPSRHECINGHCYTPCTAGACPSKRRCSNGMCDFSCTGNEQCNGYQRCVCGLCMFVCLTNSHCSKTQACHNGICRQSCFNRRDCQVAGHICTKSLCLQNCTESDCNYISTRSSQCDCSRKVSDDYCASYEVRCPPSTYPPKGLTLIEVKEAKTCNQLVSSSICNLSSQLCVCKSRSIRYGGAKCLPEMNACEHTENCPSTSDKCANSYCQPHCSVSCEEGLSCRDGYCQVQCREDSDCLVSETCVNRVCKAIADTVLVLRRPPCQPDGGCSEIYEVCDQKSDHCFCGPGLRRFPATGLCVWDIHRACLACTPCISTCSGDYMICNTALRTCVCEYGYQLDSTGVSCSTHDSATTGIDCTSLNDCNQLPNSMCNPHIGKCQCREGYCYSSRRCKAQVDKCRTHSCGSDSVCQNPMCSSEEENEPVCISLVLLRFARMFNETCTSTEDCGAFLEGTYCHSGRCTCLDGTIISSDKCVPGVYCNRDLDCTHGTTCRNRLCDRSLATKERGTIRVKFGALSAAIVTIIIIGSILFIALWVVVMMAVRRRFQAGDAVEEARAKKSQSIVAQKSTILTAKRSEIGTRVAASYTVNYEEIYEKEQKAEEEAAAAAAAAAEAAAAEAAAQQAAAHTKNLSTANSSKTTKAKTKKSVSKGNDKLSLPSKTNSQTSQKSNSSLK